GNGATAALDVGVWDLAAKIAGLPLYRLLGGYRNRVPAYASLRLGRALPTEKLPDIASSLVAQGFRAMKMNLGGQATVDAELVRVGGITPYLKVAHLAEVYGLPLACHLLPEISCQVVAAVPNGLIVEYVPWAWRLFHGCPELDGGDLVLSERPGSGLELDTE